MPDYYFPFGEPLKKVEQKDRTPKKAFVLGVYASAVHARWVDGQGKQKVAALAVASEPEIFWRGDNAAQIIHSIAIPPALGKLQVPANKSFNGPSGVALDELYLKPLGLSRANTWLCDLLPESRVNPAQREALNRHYQPVASRYHLPPASIPDFDQKLVHSEARRHQILEELEASKADTIILLGDYPVKYFLQYTSDISYSRLSQFTPYGIPRLTTIRGMQYTIYALCHPRQSGRLGLSSSEWFTAHQNWVASVKPIL